MRIVLFTGLVLAWVLAGCSGLHSVDPIHAISTPAQQADQALVTINHALTWANILGFLGLAAGLGVFIYGAVEFDKALEHIGLVVEAVAACVIIVSLTGIIALPYAKPVILCAAVVAAAGAGYEVYVNFFAKKTVAPTTAK